MEEKPCPENVQIGVCPWKTIEQAAKYLRLNRRKVRKAYLDGRLPGCKEGEILIFHMDDLRSFKKGD